MDVVSRQSAAYIGVPRYFTGSACKNGHVAERYVAGSGCVVCARERTRDKYRSDATVRARNLDSSRNHQARNPQRHAAAYIASEAKRSGIVADKQFLCGMTCPNKCPVLGTPISFARGVGPRRPENIASFDRTNPCDGYVRGNVQIISKKANTTKSNATPDELRKFAEWIRATHGRI